MRLADYVMNRLALAGIRHVFLVTGRGSLFLTDALAKENELSAVCTHHEQAAAFAAVAYAQQTGNLGACLVSTGCASTNAITGVLAAWQDGLPCIFISGQNTLAETTHHTGISIRTYGQQEADIVELVRPITKFAMMLQKPEDVFNALETAIEAATTGRKGPAWIDIPLDLQSAHVAPPTPAVLRTSPYVKPIVSDETIEALLKALREAERPVVLIGSGVRSANAETDLRFFIERWKIPLTYAASAPDSYGSTHNLSIGSVGSMGCSRAGNFTLQNADLALILGCRLTSLTTGPDYCKFARAASVHVVDIDPVEHSKNSIQIDNLIQADLKDLLVRLNQASPSAARIDWLERVFHWKRLFAETEPAFQCDERIDLYTLASTLSVALPRPSTLVTDSGLIEVILPTNIRFSDGINCIHPVSQGAMGFALPAAVGAYFASPKTVVAVVGDGSIMMNLQELETIRHHQLPIKILIVNNNVYSIIRRRQRDLFRKRIIGTDPSNGVSCPDFSKVAESFDFDYLRIERPSELSASLHNVLNSNRAVICEIMGRADQGYIEVAQARSNFDGRYVRRPLEDQAPFLPREIFLREMIIDPIDQ